MAINRHRPDLGIEIDRTSPEPVFQQIRRQLGGAIAAGSLAEGDRLPPERTLARVLGVNRSTVLAAYRELKAEGLVSGHVGRGTEVALARDALEPGQAFPWEPIARTGPAATDPLIRDLLDDGRADVVSLALGLPARELLPIDDLREVHEHILTERGPDALLHSPTEGAMELRRALSDRLLAEGAHCEPAQVMVTTGSQQGIDLVSRVYLAPDDVVAMEDPGYLGALLTFRRAGVRIAPIPVDAEGMRIDALESLLARRRPKLIYTVPTFQNPTGTEMSLARRRALLELAARHQVPVLEESTYSELRYEGDPLPSLFALDRAGCVLHLGTASKQLFPGFRVGWLAGPAAALRPLAYAKQTADLHTGTFGQLVVERFLVEGRLDRHLPRMRREYARRRDVLLAGLDRERVEGLAWNRPRGGFYVWCRLPEGVALPRLMAEAARERVSFLPGTMFSSSGGASRHIRLNFSGAPAERLREGAKRLARAMASAAKDTAPHASESEGLRPIV
jgi:DNA-binding transcriptional MocR family regulator